MVVWLLFLSFTDVGQRPLKRRQLSFAIHFPFFIFFFILALFKFFLFCFVLFYHRYYYVYGWQTFNSLSERNECLWREQPWVETSLRSFGRTHRWITWWNYSNKMPTARPKPSPIGRRWAPSWFERLISSIWRLNLMEFRRFVATFDLWMASAWKLAGESRGWALLTRKSAWRHQSQTSRGFHLHWGSPNRSNRLKLCSYALSICSSNILPSFPQIKNPFKFIQWIYIAE